MIRSRIVHLDEQRHNATLRLSTLEDAEGELDEMPAVGHTHLGSPQKPTTLGAVEQEKSSNQAFRDFHNKFVTFINQFAHAHNIPLPNGEEWFVPTGQAEVCRVVLSHGFATKYSYSIDPRVPVSQG